MIKSWRDAWQIGNFPFYYVQIAPNPYGGGQAGKSGMLRDAQRKSLSTPQTGMVVTMDIGSLKTIHPSNKQDVGIRLANWALAKTYNKTGIPYSGPLYSDMKIEGNKIRITFNYSENGLQCKGTDLSCFEIASNDKLFVKAEAKIEGNTVVVYSKDILTPKAVRFAFADTDQPNLFNKEGLPASSFRTDNW